MREVLLTQLERHRLAQQREVADRMLVRHAESRHRADLRTVAFHGAQDRARGVVRTDLDEPLEIAALRWASTTHTRFSTRAGTHARASALHAMSISRSAAATSAGVVFAALHDMLSRVSTACLI